MELSYKLVLSLLKASGMLFGIGTLGCIALDLIMMISSPGPDRFRYLSTVYENVIVFAAACVIGAVLGTALTYCIHGRVSLEE